MGERDMIHDFKKSREKADSEKLHPFWESIYKEMFPNFVEMTGTIGNLQMQKKGIDRIIILNNNKFVFIDEKVRFKNYEDICLEYISSDNTNSPGWMEKQVDIDWLAYAFIPSNKCYMIPFPLLKRVWKYYKNSWISDYRRIVAKNNGYNTISVAVPIDVIKHKISDSTMIQL